MVNYFLFPFQISDIEILGPLPVKKDEYGTNGFAVRIKVGLK
jgi:hypothetical protein